MRRKGIKLYSLRASKVGLRNSNSISEGSGDPLKSGSRESDVIGVCPKGTWGRGGAESSWGPRDPYLRCKASARALAVEMEEKG